MKKISVIVPCYNATEHLERCMEHLIRQTIGIENIEIVLVNDASTDNGATWELMKRYESRFPESILIIDLEENLRQGGARNVGISYASGEYLMFCDADDWLRLETMEILYETIKSDDVDVVEFLYKKVFEYTGVNTPIECGKGSYLRLMEDEQAKQDVIMGSTDDFTLGCCNKIYRMSLIKENNIKFADHLVCEEPSFVLVTRAYEKKHIFLDAVLYYYFQTPTGTVRGSWDKKKLDNAKVWMILLQDLEERGILQRYPIELEYMFWSWGVGLTISMLLQRGYVITGEEMKFLKDMVLERFPNVRQNPYLTRDDVKWNEILLTMLEMDFSEENIQQLNLRMRQCMLEN